MPYGNRSGNHRAWPVVQYVEPPVAPPAGPTVPICWHLTPVELSYQSAPFAVDPATEAGPFVTSNAGTFSDNGAGGGIPYLSARVIGYTSGEVQWSTVWSPLDGYQAAPQYQKVGPYFIVKLPQFTQSEAAGLLSLTATVDGLASNSITLALLDADANSYVDAAWGPSPS